MPTGSSTQSIHLTLGFLCIFIIAFFPGLPHYLFALPLRLIWSSSPAQLQPRSVSPSTSCPIGCVPLSLLQFNKPIDSYDMSTSWFQKTISLPSKSRGSYLITDHVVSSLPEIKDYKIGILNLFVQHTSCALSLNENWDSDVREDMSDALDRIAPEDRKGTLYRHSAEGLDDMPAHIKSALIGASVSVPISNGKLATGTWQGIWYLEFRTSKHSRRVVATIQGEKNA